MLRRTIGWAMAGVLAAAVPASTQTWQPMPHTQPAPLYATLAPPEAARAADAATQVERDRPALWALAEHRRLAAALTQLQPQRRGVVDAYVVSVGFDSDLVFGREAREAARVLARRYDAAGRTVVLAGSDGRGESDLPRGAPDTLATVLARVAELMDPAEDVLVLYTTGHGAPAGLAYADGNEGFAMISPTRLWTLLGQLGIANRLVILSACYSGVFVPMLASPTTAILTAASAERTSFGCRADNDWTYFGDALINHALRKPGSLAAAGGEAAALVARWEGEGRLTPSQPQVSIGDDVARWLAPLEARTPRGATSPTGRPATDALLP